MTANTILYFTVPGIIDEIMTGKIVDSKQYLK